MRRPGYRRLLFRAAGILLLSVATASVAAGCTASINPDVAVDPGEKDMTRWTLPLDPYLLSSADLTKAAYASAIMIDECLSDKGIDHTVPYVDIDAAYGSDLAVRTWFDASVAKNWGYHDPTQEHPAGLKAWDDFQLEPWTDAENEVFVECRTAVESDTPRYGDNLLNFTSGLASAAYSGAAVDPNVTVAAEKWHTCMSDVGIEDLPASPVDMPSESVRERFDLIGGIDAPVSDPTADEIELALTDASCRESSGFTSAFYEGLWSRETTMLKDNESALRDVATKITAVSVKIDDVIAESRAG